MAIVKVRNICNDVGIGAFYHSPSYSPGSHTLPFEPYLGQVQLKLNEQMCLDEEFIKKHLDYFKELRDARIIDFSMPVEENSFKEASIDLSEETKKELLNAYIKTKKEEKVLEEIFGLPLEDKEEETKCGTFTTIEEITKEENPLESTFKKVGKKKR